MRKRKKSKKKKRQSVARSGIGKRTKPVVMKTPTSNIMKNIKESKVMDRVRTSMLGRFFRKLRG